MSVNEPRKEKKERFPRLIVQLLISYALIVSMGVGFFVVPARDAVNILRAQSQADQAAAVQRYARSADSVLTLFSNVATAFLSDKAMFAIAHDQSTDINQDYYRIISQLKQYNMLYGNIFQHIYIYDSAQDNVLSVTGLSKSTDMYTAKLSASMRRETYDAMLSKGMPGKPLLLEDSGTVYISHTLPFRYPDDRYALVIFSVPLQNFFSFSAEHDQAPDLFGMYRPSDALFLGDPKAAREQVMALAATDDLSSGAGTDVLDAGKLFMIHAATNDRLYFFVMPPNLYNNQIASFSTFLTISLLVFLSVSVLIVLLSIWQHYMPLKRLLKEIDMDKIDSLSRQDYDMVLHYLAGVKQERDEYKGLIINRNPRLRRLLLSTLVTDTALAEGKAEETLRLLEIDFPHPVYAMIVIDILDESELFFSPAEDAKQHSKFLIENVLGDLLPKDARRLFFEVDASLVCLLNVDTDECTQSIMTALQDQLLFAADFLMSELNLFCQFSVSSLHNIKTSFPIAYSEALECAKQIHSHDQFVAFYDGLSDIEDKAFANLQLFTVDHERKLKNALRNGDGDKARQLIEGILCEAGTSRTEVHPLVYKSMCRHIVCSVVDVLSFMSTPPSAIERRLLDMLDMETRTMSPQQMGERISAVCEDIARQVQTSERKRTSKLMEDINAYVDQNYADKALGVTSIADVFSMSVSALSSFYSHNSSVGLCKHINRIRIQHACQLLLEHKEMPLDGVANLVGYVNTRTFTRVFSAEMQCSPGRFREKGK